MHPINPPPHLLSSLQSMSSGPSASVDKDVGSKLDKLHDDQSTSATKARRAAAKKSAAAAAATAAVKAAMLAADLMQEDKRLGKDKDKDKNKGVDNDEDLKEVKDKDVNDKGKDKASEQGVGKGSGRSQGQGLAQGLTLAPVALPMRQEASAAGGGGAIASSVSGGVDGSGRGGAANGGTGTSSGQGRFTRGSSGLMSGFDRMRRATLDLLVPNSLRRPTLQIHATTAMATDPVEEEGLPQNVNHDNHDGAASRRTSASPHGSTGVHLNKVDISPTRIHHHLSHAFHKPTHILIYSLLTHTHTPSHSLSSPLSPRRRSARSPPCSKS